MSWETVKLGDVTNNLDNMRIPLNEMQRKEKESQELYPYIGANNVLGYIDEYIFDEKILCIAEDGGSWGKNQKCCFIVNEKCWVNNHAHVITAKNVVSLEYLMNYLNYADLDKYITGTTRGKLTKTALNSIRIPLPPLPIQQKIAAILDQADALRKKDQQLLAKYDELLQAVFYDMFGDPVRNEKGWEKLNGNEYAEKISVGVVIQPASYYVEKGVIALRSLNIRPNKIVLENLVYFSEQANKNQLHKSILKENDVVIVRTGATGTAAVVPKILDGCNCIDLIIVRADKSIINPIYLSLFFNSDFGKNIVSGKEVGGIQKHFNIGAIKSLSIPVPRIGIQNRFAVIVKNILQQKEVLKLQIEHSENLFQGLLQRSFKGELVK